MKGVPCHWFLEFLFPWPKRAFVLFVSSGVSSSPWQDTPGAQATLRQSATRRRKRLWALGVAIFWWFFRGSHSETTPLEPRTSELKWNTTNCLFVAWWAHLQHGGIVAVTISSCGFKNHGPPTATWHMIHIFDNQPEKLWKSDLFLWIV